MPRIDLSVPYAHKDEAKKLGAKWDAAKKVWYVPDGLDAGPFQRWAEVPSPSVAVKDIVLPEVVVFKRDDEGQFKARIDDLEVGFDSNGGCHILHWEKEMSSPCEYENSACPEDEKRDWRNCSIVDDCPYVVATEMAGHYTGWTSSEGTRVELEAIIREVFRTKMHLGHRSSWPEPAASIFATVPWQFRE